MSARHTPGPWRVIAYGIDTGPQGAFVPFGGCGVCGCCGSPWMNGEKDCDQADAYLIAAAPDLLEALESLVSFHESLDPTGVALDEFNAGRAAIAKARGQS